MGKAAATRLTILQQAFGLIYVKGYQATSIDDIIAATQVTKGAFFYHFRNKDDMGLAVINEVMLPAMQEVLIAPLKQPGAGVADIYSMMKQLLLETPFLQVQYGCPAGNLTQEMSPVNEVFSAALLSLADQWEQVLKALINKERRAGNIRADINAQQVAYFIMSGYWGIRAIGKLHNNIKCYSTYLKELKRYLEGLQ